MGEFKLQWEFELSEFELSGGVRVIQVGVTREFKVFEFELPG